MSQNYIPQLVFRGKPFITVSAKGISNGLSNTFNDGADFGPDTLLNATAPNQYGPPFTQTTGIQEALNYLIPLGGGQVILKDPSIYYINEPLQILGNVSITITGATKGWVSASTGDQWVGPVIAVSSTFSGSQMLSYFSETQNIGSITIEKLQFLGSPLGNTINGIMTNVVPSGYYQFPQTIIRDVKFSRFNVAFNINSPGGPNIIDNVQVTSSNTCIVANASTHITSLELFSTGSSTTPSFQANGVINVDNVFIAGAQGNNDIICSGGQLNINTVYIQPDAEVGFIQNYNQLIIGNLFIDGVNNNQWLLSVASTPSYTEISNVIMRLSANYSQLFNYNPGLNYSSSIVNIKNFEIVPGSYTFALGSLPPGLTNFEIEGLSEVLTTTTNGITAGTVKAVPLIYKGNYKKVVFYFNGYENDTTTNQTINYPLPFSTIAAITSNNTGLTISASTSGITVTSPNSTATFSGIVVVEGY